MRRVIIALVLASVAFLSARPCFGQDCTGMWQLLLDTDPSHPKGIAGDTVAAYGMFSFWGDPGAKYVLQGNFPHARFMSVETNETRWGLKEDALFDSDVQPDAGSSNPFQPGVDVDIPARAFTIDVIPQGAPTTNPNVLHIRSGLLQHSVLFRVYAPNGGRTITASDFPTITALDAETGESRACPANAPVKVTLDLPQLLTLVVRRKSAFDFFELQVPWGPNSAIPGYVGGAERMGPQDALLIEFKAPTHVDNSQGPFPTDTDVRYWSLCSDDLVKLVTLACLIDSAAKPDANGIVHVIFGPPAGQATALARGYSYLPDTRAPSQRVAEFVYRNILPSAAFTPTMYQGENLPHATLIDASAVGSLPSP